MNGDIYGADFCGTKFYRVASYVEACRISTS